MAKYKDENYALSCGVSHSLESTYGDDFGASWRQIVGNVETKWGFVRAMAWHGSKAKYSELSIIKDGRIYCRRIYKAYEIRGLVTKARQFAKALNNEG